MGGICLARESREKDAKGITNRENHPIGEAPTPLLRKEGS